MPLKNGNNAAYEVNNEIRNIYEYCLAAGLTHEEIVEKARPYLQHPLQCDASKKTILTILKIGICCLALSFTLASDTISRSVLTHGRHFMFKVLAFWDWTDLYSETCLLDNPYYLDEQVYVVDCQTNGWNIVYAIGAGLKSRLFNKACEDVYDVDYLNSTSTDEISQLYMQRNIPVIVRDAMLGWPVMKETFTILNLTEGFYNLKEDICMFQTNLRVGNHYKFFDKLLNQDMKKWYAHWENCDKSTQKLLRKFYSRPYFMPGVVQMTESNWILMSSGYSGKKFKKVDVMSSITAMWVAQVWGYNRIQFQPKEPCNKMCNTLEDTIEEGEIVLFNPAIWTLSYLPGDRTENLAIAAGGFSHFS